VESSGVSDGKINPFAQTVRTSPLWIPQQMLLVFIAVVLICLFWFGCLFLLWMDKMEKNAGHNTFECNVPDGVLCLATSTPCRLSGSGR
jgi:hypothetical protein